MIAVVRGFHSVGQPAVTFANSSASSFNGCVFAVSVIYGAEDASSVLDTRISPSSAHHPKPIRRAPPKRVSPLRAEVLF